MSRRSTRVAWSLLGTYTVGIGTTAILAVADGRLQRDWQGLLAQMLAHGRLCLYLSTVILPLLLFPTGRPLSPRRRPVLWITAGRRPACDRQPARIRRRRPAQGRPGGLGSRTGAGLMVLLAMTGSLRFPRADTLSSALTLGLLPVAAGVAILRYRLYDIDRLINRTLVYGALTALLGTVYAAAVLVLGQLFGGVGGNPPSWAVAGATLAVAALFQPVRGRTQAVVDRRFNRRRHDAAKTIQAFSTRLRDQIDLDTLSTELLAVVDQTMEPTQVSLWRRPSASGRPGRG